MSIYNFQKSCIISFCISTNQNHMQNNISTDDEYDENETQIESNADSSLQSVTGNDKFTDCPL